MYNLDHYNCLQTRFEPAASANRRMSYRSITGLRHLLAPQPPKGGARDVLSNRLSDLLQRPGSNQRHEVAHIYGSLIFNFLKKGKKQQVKIHLAVFLL